MLIYPFLSFHFHLVMVLWSKVLSANICSEISHESDDAVVSHMQSLKEPNISHAPRHFSTLCVILNARPPLSRQPTVHFAEEPITCGGGERDDDDDEEEEEGDRSDEEGERRPAAAEKQRLIRKDTPHYKKHFKITKLPKPEAVAALLQGFTPESLLPPPPRPHQESRPQEEEEEEPEEGEGEGEGGPVTPEREKHHRPQEAQLEDSRLQVNTSQAKVHTNTRTYSARLESSQTP